MSDFTSQIPAEPQAGAARSALQSGEPKGASDAQRRLRLWPAVVIVALQWILMIVPVLVARDSIIAMMTAKMGAPLLGFLGVVLWWLVASRLRWRDRLLVLVACVVLGVAAYPFNHPTFDLFPLFMFTLPVLTTAWVLWLVLTPFLSWPVRRAGLLVVFVLVWGLFTQVRFDGVWGSFAPELSFRWVPRAQDNFETAVRSGKIGVAENVTDKPLVLTPADWPGFRGPERDGRRTGLRIATDWEKSPPKELWKHEVGAGWSSFAVVGNRLFTQMQWDKQNEAVVCYDADTGKQIWVHKTAAIFSEKLGGDGPRATPTFSDGKIFALGATGWLDCLDALTGRVLWSHNIVADSGAKLPIWGFCSSPLVVQGVVTVFAGGEGGKSVLGYHADSGKLAWSAGEGKVSYCSMQRAHLGGVEQLLITTENGLAAYQPARGEVLWQFSFPGDVPPRVVQPAILSDSDVLLGTGADPGTKRLHIDNKDNKWTAQEVWTSRAIKPNYNDLVVHAGHLYGFDADILTCVTLDSGQKKWRARGYGNGQVLLLADQGLLLVLSEEGEVALVKATPDNHKEIGRFRAFEGKTWNHPAVANGKLFVRNGEWAACFDLNERK
jgi:outer membrane protein assembly factor BamB